MPASPEFQRTPPRLVLVSHGSGFDGGAEIAFRESVLALIRHQPDLDLVTLYPRAGILSQLDKTAGIATRNVPIPRWADFGRVGLLRRLLRFASLLVGFLVALITLRRLRPSAVVSNTMVIPAHAMAAKLLGIPHYWMIHEFGQDDHDLQFLLGYRRTCKLIARWSKTVICCSRAVERSILLASPEMSTMVVYQAVDSPIIPPRRRSTAEPLRVILVGRLAESKGQMLALHAIAEVLTRGVTMQLVLVGPGDPRALLKESERLGVASLVELHPATDDLAPHWAAAHVALMCSRAEAFGRVTVEAMKAGLPVCGVDSGGTPEVVTAGVNGLLSPPGDASALAANLLALHSDEGLRWRLAENASRSTSRFSLDQYGADLATVLEL